MKEDCAIKPPHTCDPLQLNCIKKKYKNVSYMYKKSPLKKCDYQGSRSTMSRIFFGPREKTPFRNSRGSRETSRDIITRQRSPRFVIRPVLSNLYVFPVSLVTCSLREKGHGCSQIECRSCADRTPSAALGFKRSFS